MQLSDKDLADFQALYKKQFGKEISKAEALEQGTKLIQLMKLVYKPMTQAELEAVKARRKNLLDGSL